MKNEVRLFLNKCKIPFDSENQLVGMLIPRDILLSEELYDIVKEDIPQMKRIFSSTWMRALQSTAPKKDKWPLLNLVRQILKVNNFNMKPVRKCNGYAKGKKLYLRYFQIERFKKVEDVKIPFTYKVNLEDNP